MDRAIEPDEDRRARRAAVAEFVEGLRLLRLEAGQPAFRTMAKVSGKVSHATLHDALTGVRLPTWPTVAAFVAACGGDLAEWRQRWLVAAQESRPESEDGVGLIPEQSSPAEVVEVAAAPAPAPTPTRLPPPRSRRVTVLAFLSGLMLGAVGALGIASWAGFMGGPTPVACPTSDADAAGPAAPLAGSVTAPVARVDDTSATYVGGTYASATQQTAAATGPSWVGRPASDAQILTSTAVVLPVTTQVTAGDALVVTLMLTSTCPGQVTVTDTLGDSFGVVADDTDTARHRTMIFAAFGVKPLTTADAIHVAYPHASKYHVGVDEFHGITTVVGHAHAHGESGGVAFSTGPSLTCAPGQLMVAAVGTNTGSAPTLVSGWTTVRPVLKLSSYRLTTGYQVVSTPGACAVTGTTTAQWGAALAVFR